MFKNIFALSLFALVISSVVYYANYSQDQVVLDVARVIQGQGELADLIEVAQNNCATLMTSSEDNRPYFVASGETLAVAMARGSVATPIFFKQEKGNCVRADSEYPPDEDQVACQCYEKTGCGGQESSTCKRHCKRNLCKCCPGT